MLSVFFWEQTDSIDCTLDTVTFPDNLARSVFKARNGTTCFGGAAINLDVANELKSADLDIETCMRGTGIAKGSLSAHQVNALCETMSFPWDSSQLELGWRM